MAYTTQALVVSMFRNLEIGATTVVTADKITAWIDQQDAYINGRLNHYYVTPVAGPISLKILELIATYKVAHMVKTVLEVTIQSSDKVQEVQTNLDKKADKMLDELLPDGDEPPVLKLPDAELQPLSGDGGAVTSLQAREATFRKNGNNW